MKWRGEKGENEIVDFVIAAGRVGGAKYDLFRNALLEDRIIYSSSVQG